jgi:hypothetical protein
MREGTGSGKAGKTKAKPEVKPAPPDPNVRLFKSLLVLIAHQRKDLPLVDFADAWLTNDVIKVVPEGEEIIVSLIKEMIADENHDGLRIVLDELNNYADWIYDMIPTHRKELLDILTGVVQRFGDTKSLVTVISQVFADVPSEAIDAMREAELDEDTFDEVVKKMFVYIQENC